MFFFEKDIEMIQNDNPADGRCWEGCWGLPHGFISWLPTWFFLQTGGPQQPALQPGSQLQRKMALEAGCWDGFFRWWDGWICCFLHLEVLETVVFFFDFLGAYDDEFQDDFDEAFAKMEGFD